MSFNFQELSEHDIYLEDCDNNEPGSTLLDDNSNDENDVDDETMSGEMITRHCDGKNMDMINIFLQAKMTSRLPDHWYPGCKTSTKQSFF